MWLKVAWLFRLGLKLQGLVRAQKGIRECLGLTYGIQMKLQGLGLKFQGHDIGPKSRKPQKVHVPI